MSTVSNRSVIVLGAGVAGLTTASTLLARYPSTLNITIIAKHLPGDTCPAEYCSPQAGANWSSFETEVNQYAQYDKLTFERFREIAVQNPESGVKRFPLRLIYGNETGKAKMWFQELVGGIRKVPEHELPQGAGWGVDLVTFMYNPSIYLNWLYARLIKAGVRIIRRSYNHIGDLISEFPKATAVFNCTGLGARHLGGVEDERVHPTKGQTILISEPKSPVEKMYIWIQPSLFGADEFSHVFPRPHGGGIIIGGVRLNNEWDDSFDHSLTDRMKQRAYQLCPELGKPEDLQVVRCNVGLRPSRAGGARVEIEEQNGKLVVHNYGAGGAGYQSSWGMAQHAVDLFTQKSGLSPDASSAKL